MPKGPMNKNNKVPEKAKDFNGTMKKLIKYLAKYKFRILLVVLFAIGSAIFSIVGPKIMGNVTTEIFNGLIGKVMGTGGINFDKVEGILLLLLCLYIISALFSFIQNFIMAKVSERVMYSFRK